MFSILSDQFLFYQTVFLFCELGQPIAVTDSSFPRMFSSFSRLFFFTFPDDKLLLQFLGFCALHQCYLRIALVSWYSAALQICQLHSSRTLLVPRLADIFSPHFFEQTSSSVQYFPPYNQVAFMAAPIISLKLYLSAKQKLSAAGHTAEFPHLNSPVCKPSFV